MCGIQCSLCSVSLLSVKIWMEGAYDRPYKNPYFFVTTDYWTKSDGVFAEMHIISYNSIYYSKAYSDQFTILKDIDAESPNTNFGDNL